MSLKILLYCSISLFGPKDRLYMVINANIFWDTIDLPLCFLGGHKQHLSTVEDSSEEWPLSQHSPQSNSFSTTNLHFT